MSRRDVTSSRRVAFQASRADKVRATLALGAVLGLGSVGTMAAWSDQATATTGMFSAAAIDIKIDGQDTYEFVNLSMSDMLPGSTKQATLPVNNAGSVPFEYTMRTVVSGDDVYGQYLKVSVFANDTCTGLPEADSVPMRPAQSPIAMITAPRTLAVEGQDTLCFTVGLDATLWNEPNWSTAMDVEGKSVDVAFEFTATAL